MSIEITIKMPDLLAAAQMFTTAFSYFQTGLTQVLQQPTASPQAVMAPIPGQQAAPIPQNIAPQNQATPAPRPQLVTPQPAPVSVPLQQPVAPPSQAMPVSVPQQTPPSVSAGPSTVAPTYTLDQLANAGAQFLSINPGAMPQLTGLLQQFGIPSLDKLPPEQYGAFATALRGLGAQI